MSTTLGPLQLVPPSGVNFHSGDELPIDALVRALQRVTSFLRDLDEQTRLLRFKDWWQHDGWHLYAGDITMEELFALVESPQSVLGAMPGDDYVRVGVAAVDHSGYLRFHAYWTDDGRELLGDFDVTIPDPLAPRFRKDVVPRLGVPVEEQDAAAWYRSIRV